METAPENFPLRLKWRKTWPDSENDFVCEAPASGYRGSVGRIYIHGSGLLQGQWFWSFTAHGDDISRNFGATSGYEPSPREAARKVEDAWFMAIKGSRYETTSEPPANPYAAAKGRQ